ncbi:MAG: DUF475 domain-containing protein [Anaerolineae bacterium]|nr:MAG: DUF475 domain-containing protein [Anaerolineae bacterium]
MDLSSLLDVLSIIIQLIFLEGILSIDNAAVLGAMVSPLPHDQPVPYPRALKFLQSFTDRYLGMQQSAALKVGLLGAYVGRGLMLMLAAWVIRNPVLHLLGALYLIKLAFGYLSGEDEDEEEGALPLNQTSTFWMVVLNVELADLAFSLDNVVAAVALSDHIAVVMLGVAIGILIMRFAAGIFAWLIRREPSLATGAYLVVLNIGVELLLAEFWGIEIGAWTKFAISVMTLLLCVLYARLKPLPVLSPLFSGIARGMGWANRVVNLLFLPLGWLLRNVVHLLTPQVVD